MSDRGDYRSFYAAIVDDTDFQQLTPLAFKLMFVLKMTLGTAGIGVSRKLVLAEQVNTTPAELEALFVELESEKPSGEQGWIRRHRNIVWLVNGLRSEPTMSQSNGLHRTRIERLLAPLGDNPLTREFRAYYSEWFDNAPNNHPSDRDSIAYRKGIERESNHKRQATSDKRQQTSDSSQATGDEKALARWLARFYGDATAERQAEVRAQLAALWKGESVKLKQTPVKAKDNDHLTRKAAEMLEVGFTIRDRSKAIVILLQKLADPEKNSNGDLPSEAQAKELKLAERRADKWETERKKAVAEWEKAYPAEVTAIEADIRAKMTTSADEVNYRLEFNIRKVELISERIGFPDFERWSETRAAS